MTGKRHAAALLGFFDLDPRPFLGRQSDHTKVFAQIDDRWRRGCGKERSVSAAGQSKVRHLLNEPLGFAVLETHIHKPMIVVFGKMLCGVLW